MVPIHRGKNKNCATLKTRNWKSIKKLAFAKCVLISFHRVNKLLSRIKPPFHTVSVDSHSTRPTKSISNINSSTRFVYTGKIYTVLR